MILLNYEEKIVENTESYTMREIIFDKVRVWIFADAKYSRSEIRFRIKDSYKRKNIELSEYIKAINDYLISHPFYGICYGKTKNLFDFQYIKFLEFHGLKFDVDEFQLINYKYPNLTSVTTFNCTIYRNALIGCLKCKFRDYSSDIMSLDSFNGFTGDTISLNNTKIREMNKNALNLLCNILEIENVDLDYERFFLTTNAPKVRKLKILRTREKVLKTKDLLFISGFFNLESIEINGIVENYDQIKKLEKLRRIQYLLQTKQSEIDRTRQLRSKYIEKMKERGVSEQQLQDYIMFQSMVIQNDYLDLLHKLYVSRLERVKWENKISTKDFEKIKEELISISKMPIKQRKRISKELREFNLFDSLNELWFDKIPDKEEEYVLVNSSPSPFDNSGIDYYVKSKKIIIDD